MSLSSRKQEAMLSRTSRTLFGVAVPVAGILALALVFAPAGNAGGTGPGCGGFSPDEVLTGGSDTTFVGTDGRDVVVGSSDEDHIRGKGGNDVLCGQSSDDRINGGEGNDNLYGQDGDDTLRGRPGEDFMDGGFSFDKRGFEEDFCLGGKPFPDTKASHDDATNCEEVTSAFQIQGS